jgi:hypothetical protein
MTETLDSQLPVCQKRPMAEFTLSGFDLDLFVASTLAEDLGAGLQGGGFQGRWTAEMRSQSRACR